MKKKYKDELKGIKIRNSKLRGHLKPILEEWIEVISVYTNDFDVEDSLYWYNERATLSTFASAAARCGFHVLEEYRHEKKDTRPEKKKKMKTGRADLFLARNRTTFVAEAKQIFPIYSSRSNFDSRTLARGLKSARDDVRDVTEDADYKLGILFCTPRIPKKNIPESSEILRSKIIEFKEKVMSKEYARAIDYGACAFVFPSDSKASGTKYHYPGVVCFIRVLRRDV